MAQSPQNYLPLLKEVSRSFYVTIRVLPRAMREAVSLAYLLARATDTLADAAMWAPEERLERLRRLRAEIADEAQSRRGPEGGWREEEAREEGGNAECRDPDARHRPPTTDHRPLPPGEARLLETVPELITWLRGMADPMDREAVRWVLGVISAGQILDIERFELGSAPQEVRALANAEELEDYTYRVAGCVGEFWTKLALRKFPGRYAAGVEEAELLRLGVEFGIGLQLVNILRDFPGDVAKGRCYLPEDELRAAGVGDWAALREDPAWAAAVWMGWLWRARGYLESAQAYALHLRSWRMRFACALPVALGLATLDLAQAEMVRTNSIPRGVKVARATVKRMMGRYFWACRSRAALGREWSRA